MMSRSCLSIPLLLMLAGAPAAAQGLRLNQALASAEDVKEYALTPDGTRAV